MKDKNTDYPSLLATYSPIQAFTNPTFPFALSMKNLSLLGSPNSLSHPSSSNIVRQSLCFFVNPFISSLASPPLMPVNALTLFPVEFCG